MNDDPYKQSTRTPPMGSVVTMRIADDRGTWIGTAHVFHSGRALARDDRHGLTSWHDSLEKAIAEVRRRVRCKDRVEAVCP